MNFSFGNTNSFYFITLEKEELTHYEEHIKQ